MYSLKISAQFAAYTWYTEIRGRTTHEEALRFAEQHWASFVSAAHEGWGKLLMKVARPRRAERGRVGQRQTKTPGQDVVAVPRSKCRCPQLGRKG
jgi:hypothetical protein